MFASRELLEIVSLVGVRALQQHAVGSLGRSRDGDDEARFTRAGDRTLGVQEVTVLGAETQRGFKGLQFLVGAILRGSLFEKMSPGSEVSRSKMGERLHGFNGRGFGEIVDRLIDFQLFQSSLLGGERFGGRLVRAIGGEPDAMTDGEDIVVG